MIVQLHELMRADSAAEVVLAGPESVVGRSPGCDLTVPCACVSRHHCVIRIDQDTVELEDLESRNGTFVNGHRVRRCVLKDGDFLAIGTRLFQVAVRPDGNLPGTVRAAAAPLTFLTVG